MQWTGESWHLLSHFSDLLSMRVWKCANHRVPEDEVWSQKTGAVRNACRVENQPEPKDPIQPGPLKGYHLRKGGQSIIPAGPGPQQGDLPVSAVGAGQLQTGDRRAKPGKTMQNGNVHPGNCGPELDPLELGGEWLLPAGLGNLQLRK